MATDFTIDSGIADPIFLSQLLGRGMDLFPMLQETSSLQSVKGYTPLYHGTTSAPEIMKQGFTGSKIFASPDYSEALKYAKEGPLSGTKYGTVTGDVLKTKVPTAQLQALLKRGLTGGQEVVLSPQEATKIFQQGIGNIKGSSSLISRLGKKTLPYLRTTGKLFNRFPVATAISDALFGTNYTMGAVNDINNLFNMFTPTQQAQPEPEPEPTIAQQQAQTQQNIINQINQANQNNQNNQNNQGGGGGGNVSGPAGMSGPSSSPKPRGPNLVNRAQGGIVSINDMIGRM